MLITFTHDFHSINKWMWIYIKDESSFPIKLGEQTLSSEQIRALENLWMVEVTNNLDNETDICLDEVIWWVKQKWKLLLTLMTKKL